MPNALRVILLEHVQDLALELLDLALGAALALCGASPISLCNRGHGARLPRVRWQACGGTCGRSARRVWFASPLSEAAGPAVLPTAGSFMRPALAAQRNPQAARFCERGPCRRCGTCGNS